MSDSAWGGTGTVLVLMVFFAVALLYILGYGGNDESQERDDSTERSQVRGGPRSGSK